MSQQPNVNNSNATNQQQLELYSTNLELLQKVANLASKQVEEVTTMEELTTKHPELLATIFRISNCTQKLLTISLLDNVDVSKQFAKQLNTESRKVHHMT